MRFLTGTFAILACLFLAGCFDVREEIWIERDGSGRAAFEYVIPRSALAIVGGEAGLEAEIRKLFDSEPDLRLDGLSITGSGREATIALEASTDSMLSLTDLPDNELIKDLPDATKGFAGSFDVRLDGLAIEFQRKIDLKQALGLATVAIGGDQRRERRLSYIIHLPTAAKTHDATRAENGGKTLVWDYSLGEALLKPVNTSFRADIPIPWWIILAALTVLGLLAWGATRIWRRRSRRAPITTP